MKLYRNIFIVWFATGIWHGAEWNYALWGLYYGVVLTIEKGFLLKFLEKIPRIFSHIYAIIIIIIGWTLFAVEGNGTEALSYISILFGNSSVGFINSDVIYYLSNYGIMLVICTLFSIPLTRKLKISDKIKEPITQVLIIVTLVICTAYLVDATYNPFLYFRF